jgi:hypothetical protein
MVVGMIPKDNKQHIESFGVPLDTMSPNRWWLASVDHAGEMPTDEELKAIRSFIDAIINVGCYSDHYAAQLSAMKLPFDSGHNTVIFRKYANGFWGYRQATWTHGPVFMPAWDSPKPLNLVQVMDRYYTIARVNNARWTKWKDDHADIFAIFAVTKSAT